MLHRTSCAFLFGSLTLGTIACSDANEVEPSMPGGAAGSAGNVSAPTGGTAGAGASMTSAGMGGGGSPGAAGNASGGVGGGGMSSGGEAGSGTAGASGGMGGSGGAGPAAKLTITVDSTTMADRLCFEPEASNSGGNHSPKIDWTGVPEGTQSLVLTMYDQSNTTPHRIVCNLPPTTLGQPADIGTAVPAGAQVSTGHSKPGNPWYGPGAGGNAHSYEIRIWALATPTLEGGCSESGAEPTRAVYEKLTSAPATLVLASDFKVLWGNVNGMCTP